MLEKNPNTETEMPSSIQVENDGHLISQTPYDYSTGSGPDFIHTRLRKENQLSKAAETTKKSTCWHVH